MRLCMGLKVIAKLKLINSLMREIQSRLETRNGKILFLPGHSPGHIGFYDMKEKVIFSGDVLFEHSIGRTDLPGGNFDTLIKSIHQNLFTLPDEVVVYCGHGPSTTHWRRESFQSFLRISLIR